MTFMLMNKSMYTMNASEYLFRNMFEKQVESTLDDDDSDLVLSFKTALDDSFYDDNTSLVDNDTQEIVFGNEQFEKLWNTKYNTFEKPPFDSEEEWIVVMNDNGPVDNYANRPEDGDCDDDDDMPADE